MKFKLDENIKQTVGYTLCLKIKVYNVYKTYLVYCFLFFRSTQSKLIIRTAFRVLTFNFHCSMVFFLEFHT